MPREDWPSETLSGCAAPIVTWSASGHTRPYALVPMLSLCEPCWEFDEPALRKHRGRVPWTFDRLPRPKARGSLNRF